MLNISNCIFMISYLNNFNFALFSINKVITTYFSHLYNYLHANYGSTLRFLIEIFYLTSIQTHCEAFLVLTPLKDSMILISTV